MAKIQASAAANKVIVVLGFTENIHDSLYIAQATINSGGKILMTRKKIKPTHMERTVFGDSAGDCLRSVADTDVGRVGALSCWEHIQPLLKYHTYAQREQIHVAAWPPLHPYPGEGALYSMSKEGSCLSRPRCTLLGVVRLTIAGLEAVSQTYAIESQSFVLHCTSVLTAKGIDRMRTQTAAQMNSPGGGGSAVFAPDGRKLTTDLANDQEGIVYADLNFDEISISRSFVDVCGHYSRPDLLWLGVKDGGEWECVKGRK